VTTRLTPRPRERSRAGPRHLPDGHVQQRRDDRERDRDPPHEIVAARRDVEAASEPAAEERASWWKKKTIPPSIARLPTPKTVATVPFVSGTVESQRNPIAAPKAYAEISVTGARKKRAITTALSA